MLIPFEDSSKKRLEMSTTQSRTIYIIRFPLQPGGWGCSQWLSRGTDVGSARVELLRLGSAEGGSGGAMRSLGVTALRGKGSWQLGAKGIPQSHTAQQTSHKRLIGKDTVGRAAVSARERSSRELGRRQALYRVPWWVELSRVAWDWRDFVACLILGQTGIGGILWPHLGLFFCRVGPGHSAAWRGWKWPV